MGSSTSRFLTTTALEIPSLEFPTAKLECAVRGVFGKANDDVIQALGLEPHTGREIWLEAKLDAESAWVPRAIDVADWTNGKNNRDRHNVLVFKTLTLEADQTQQIRVASPDPASLDGV